MAGFQKPATPERKPRGWHAFTASQRGSSNTAVEAFPSLSPMQTAAPDLNPSPSQNAPRRNARFSQGVDGRRVRSNSPPAVGGRVQGRGGVFQEKAPPARNGSHGGNVVSGANGASGSESASWRRRVSGGDMRGEAVRRVKAVAPSADSALIQDLLEALNGDVTAVIAQLEEMGLCESAQSDVTTAHVENGLGGLSLVNDESREGAKRGGSLRRSSRSEGELAELERGAFRDGFGDAGWGDQTGDGREPEQDPYYKYRGEAIQISRGRARHAKSAASAFTLGDHARARELSRLAREEGKIARELHAQAAEKILQERNADRLGGIWEIDLHGLHANEAVLALAARLEELEAELFALLSSPAGSIPSGGNAPWSGVTAPSVSSGGRKASEGVPKVSEFPSFRKELMVITGLGNHSKGGPTLPSIVSSFLTESGYLFRQARAGVLAVRPRYRYIKRQS
ncbi:smr (Small MutS Related) domain-containing protein [Klebsormidium nitens]|uniref:Smr (Small MutS Related) domain-containing protein n=1 Tax=Klebsormidium nitens TaxID=105231 RepID=A0A1Y1IQ63_KLENI|nr:smr (Small MutS Related) domain-containing protein [Klebsormidium nitens]|eukprot:GAQ90278.1 smr (Small MutS Related) domain-containing protein [Klebsormidium nitens]